MAVAKLAQRQKPDTGDRGQRSPPAHVPVRPAIRPMAPIVPPGSIAGRALVAVIAIMGFLACLTVGAVSLVTDAAREWRSEVVREVTIQIRPIDGVDLEREVAKAADLARRTAGIATVRALSRAENEALLTPWLGEGLGLESLPVPRLVLVDIHRSIPPDLDALRRALAEQVRGATLDDHRPWRDRLAAMTRAVVAIGTAVLVLVLAATALSVVFATRGAMAANREIVEVLHLVGADDRFIAATFQRRFMRLGLEGGALGGLCAVIAFHLGAIVARSVSGADGGAQIEMVFGSLAFSSGGYVGILATVLAVAFVTAVTSRWTVRSYLHGQR
jgi:cell division transport system permease protein